MIPWECRPTPESLRAGGMNRTSRSARVMGSWFTKPAVASASRASSPPTSSLPSTSSATSSGVTRVPHEKPSRSYSPVAKPKRAAREPLPAPIDVRYRGRKMESIAHDGQIYASSLTIAACEDCAVVVPCVIGKAELADCKRCVVVLGPTRDRVTMRDCYDCTLVTWSASVHVIDCVGTRLAASVSAGGEVKCEGGKPTATARAMDVEYDALEKQLAQAGLGEHSIVFTNEHACGETAYEMLTGKKPSIVGVETPLRRARAT